MASSSSTVWPRVALEDRAYEVDSKVGQCILNVHVKDLLATCINTGWELETLVGYHYVVLNYHKTIESDTVCPATVSLH